MSEKIYLVIDENKILVAYLHKETAELYCKQLNEDSGMDTCFVLQTYLHRSTILM